MLLAADLLPQQFDLHARRTDLGLKSPHFDTPLGAVRQALSQARRLGVVSGHPACSHGQRLARDLLHPLRLHGAPRHLSGGARVMVGLGCQKYCCIDLFVDVDTVRDVAVFYKTVVFLGKYFVISMVCWRPVEERDGR